MEIVQKAFNKPYCQMTALDGLIVAELVLIAYGFCYFLWSVYLKKNK